MKIACLIQARLNSARLPGKVMEDIGGWPLIRHVAIRASKAIQPVIIITPDAEIAKYADELGVKKYPVQGWHDEGDANDVLGRYARAAQTMGLDGVVRVTGDCPLLDPEPIKTVLYLFQTLLYDYVANDIERTWPDGMGVECFSIGALRRAQADALTKQQREHVTPFMKNDRRNSRRNLACPDHGLAELKLSVDTQDDLDFVRAIDAAGPKDYSLKATLEAISRVEAENLTTGARH